MSDQEHSETANERTVESTYRGELIDDSAFVAGNATIRGRVLIGANASVWFGTVVRGDTEEVSIGEGSNIQDLCVLHADPGFPCRIGRNVTVGHAAVVHGATVCDEAMIGIRAVVLNGATVESGAIVGAGAVVREGDTIPAGHLAVGIPAKVVRPIDEQDAARIRRAAGHYVHSARVYRATENATADSQAER
jgi:carbonic anhydrase/acetyltransferase-like protein (isoleucine patch superfamily)